MARRRRGFFAELQHQAALADKQRQRQRAAAVKAQIASKREMERAQAAAGRAAAAAARADAASRAAAEREAKRLHEEAQKLEADNRTQALKNLLDDVANVLEATLERDDYVDLRALRQVAEHPIFRSEYQAPTPPPTPPQVPPEPVFEAPPEPRGMKVIFGAKSKYADAVAKARRQFEVTHAAWRLKAAQAPMKQFAQLQAYQEIERERLARLAEDREAYVRECAERAKSVELHNRRLDDLVAGLEHGDQAAVEEYFGIVLANSVYPEGLDVGEELAYEPSLRELSLQLFLPLPDAFPQIKGYRYVKAQDAIVEVPRTATDLRMGYASFIHQAVLRTLHEVWEADRSNLIDTISLVAGTQNLSPATGQEVYTPLVAVAVDRSTFETINLAHVQPAEALNHLKAVISKNPLNFVPIASPKGVRG